VARSKTPPGGGYYAQVRIKYNKLPQIAKAFPREVSTIMRKAVFDVVAYAQADAPVDTGNLKARIGAKGATPGSLRMQAVAEADYSAHVNWGTRFMPPRPFMTQAVERVVPEYFRALGSLEGRLEAAA
jgi:HK97 gp10 family phage protein